MYRYQMKSYYIVQRNLKVFYQTSEEAKDFREPRITHCEMNGILEALTSTTNVMRSS